MKIFLSFLALLTSLNIAAQPKEVWEIDCGDMDTQLEMNVCSYESYLLADSVLQLCYHQLQNHIDSTLQYETTLLTDSTDNVQLEIVLQLESQLTYLMQSQADFNKVRNSTIEVINLQFEGGSMSPMVANMYRLEMTVNQIKLLKSIMIYLEI